MLPNFLLLPPFKDPVTQKMVSPKVYPLPLSPAGENVETYVLGGVITPPTHPTLTPAQCTRS